MYKRILFILPALLGAVLSTAAAQPAGIDEGKIDWERTRYTRILRRDGRKILRVRVPENAPDIANTNCAFFNIDLSPFAGEELMFSVKMRGKNISRPLRSYNGIKVMLFYQDRSGKKYYRDTGEPAVYGTFDWRPTATCVLIPPGAHNGRFRLGLQASSGEVEFDLDSFRITLPGHIEKPQPLSPEQEREFNLVQSRMRAALQQNRVRPDAIRNRLALQNADGSFRDIDYSNQNNSRWLVARHLQYAREFALAWSSAGHEFHHDEALGRALRNAVKWWGENRPRSGNWWWNDMAIPQYLTEILLLAPELFPDDPLRQNILKICRQAKFLPRYTGNNRVFVAQNIFRRALVERDPAAAAEAAAVISEEVRFAPVHNKTSWAFGGIRADGCYHQHGPQIQFVNYGGEFFANVASWSNLWKDTRWQFSADQWEVIRHLAFDGFQWVLWNGNMDLLAIGRQLGRNAARSNGYRTLSALRKLSNADPGGSAPYREVLERNETKINSLIGNRHFWNSDYMVHRRPHWYASVRMNSVRVRPIEDDTNGDNALGRYFSDGSCLIQRSGNEYENITPCWDWTRLPGTTLPASPVIELNTQRRWTLSPTRDSRLLGETKFVGGVTDGTHGAAVFTMDLDGVKAKKAYFFDTDAILQLGTGICGTVPHEVATTVNCCLRNGEIKQGDNWFHHDGIGYRGEHITLKTGKRTGDWRILDGGLLTPQRETRDLFELQISHGVRPQNASYAFTILPGATPEETANWNRTEILTNTDSCQAVRFSDGTIGAIFHAPGKLGSFETRQPGIFLIAGRKVFAADPTAELRRITLTLDGVTRTIALPDGEMAGSTTEITF